MLDEKVGAIQMGRTLPSLWHRQYHLYGKDITISMAQAIPSLWEGHYHLDGTVCTCYMGRSVPSSMYFPAGQVCRAALFLLGGIAATRFKQYIYFVDKEYAPSYPYA